MYTTYQIMLTTTKTNQFNTKLQTYGKHHVAVAVAVAVNEQYE